MASTKKATDGNDIVFLGKHDDLFSALGGDDEVHGGGGNDTLFGDDGNDLLFGDQGDDQLFGGGGNDVLSGGPGSNRLDGGLGVDTADYSWYTINDQPLYINLAAGYAVDQTGWEVGSPPTLGSGQTFNDQLSGIDKVIGASNVPNVIIGDAGNNILVGGNQNDYIDAGAGNDGVDGGAGVDVIVGGPGADQLTGGAGNDFFDFFASDFSFSGLDVDVITDLELRENSDTNLDTVFDTIRLHDAQSINAHVVDGVWQIDIGWADQTLPHGHINAIGIGAGLPYFDFVFT
jgi:Ca2+-binding RTX toxin-like protein